MREVGRFIDEIVKISLDIQAKKGKKLIDFKVGLDESKEILDLNKAVHEFSCQFDIPGFNADEIDI
jgi:hypothetical protein